MWIFWQLLAYDPLSWAVFIGIAFFVARYLPGVCIPLGQIAVGIVVAILDTYWIQAEMHKPGWYGIPDQDFFFYMGVFARIVLVNSVLIPVSILGVWLRRKRVRDQVAPTPDSLAGSAELK